MFMTFNEWKNWFKNLDNSLKWFIILILIRPITDSFYFLKEISPFLSPLYIVGALTPFLAGYAIYKIRKVNYSRMDTYMSIYASLIGISSFALLISDSFSLEALDPTLKFTIPFFIYFFSRRLIRSKIDLYGVFQTFLYSALSVIPVFTYEMIFGPINAQMSRGLERYQGNYSDVMNYALYAGCSLLIGFYAFMDRPKSLKPTKLAVVLSIILLYAIMILFHIHHTATYAVITALIGLFLLYNLKANLGLGVFVLFITLSLVLIVGPESISEQVAPLVETDIKVYEGEKENEQLFHGRVGRWMNFLDFFNSKSSFVQLFGLPLGMDHPYSYIAKGSHNDFIRNLMFTGYIGIITYVLILINIIIRISEQSISTTFLGFGIMAMLLLYSVSTTPMLYPILLYLLMPILSFINLPDKLKYPN